MQVEFYFSDSNVPRDNFLRSKIDEDPEVTGHAHPMWLDFLKMLVDLQSIINALLLFTGLCGS